MTLKEVTYEDSDGREKIAHCSRVEFDRNALYMFRHNGNGLVIIPNGNSIKIRTFTYQFTIEKKSES